MSDSTQLLLHGDYNAWRSSSQAAVESGGMKESRSWYEVWSIGPCTLEKESGPLSEWTHTYVCLPR